MEEIITLVIKPYGTDFRKQEWDKLNEFVVENFWRLYEGAIRLKEKNSNDVDYFEKDSYAPERVQINKTRLHLNAGFVNGSPVRLKYANGYRWDSWSSPTEEQLMQTVKDLQILIDATAEDSICSFTINITKL